VLCENISESEFTELKNLPNSQPLLVTALLKNLPHKQQQWRKLFLNLSRKIQKKPKPFYLIKHDFMILK